MFSVVKDKLTLYTFSEDYDFVEFFSGEGRLSQAMKNVWASKLQETFGACKLASKLAEVGFRGVSLDRDMDPTWHTFDFTTAAGFAQGP